MKKIISLFVVLWCSCLIGYVDQDYDEDYFEEDNCIDEGRIFCRSSFDTEQLDVIVADILQEAALQCKSKEFDKAILTSERALRVAELLKDEEISQANIDSAAYQVARAYYKKFDSIPRYGCPLGQCSTITNTYYLEQSILFLEKISDDYKEHDFKAELDFAYDELLNDFFRRNYDKRASIYLQRAHSSSGKLQYEYALETIANLQQSEQIYPDKYFDAYSLQIKYLLDEVNSDVIDILDHMIEILTDNIDNNASAYLSEQIASRIKLGKLYLLKSIIDQESNVKYVNCFDDAIALIATNYEIDSDQYNLFYKEFITLLAEETDFFSGENNINEQFHQSIWDYLAEKCKPGSYDHNLQICIAPPKRMAPPRNLRVSVVTNKTPRLIEWIAKVRWDHDLIHTDVVKYNYCVAWDKSGNWKWLEDLSATKTNYKIEEKIDNVKPWKFKVCTTDDKNIKDCHSGLCDEISTR